MGLLQLSQDKAPVVYQPIADLHFHKIKYKGATRKMKLKNEKKAKVYKGKARWGNKKGHVGQVKGRPGVKRQRSEGRWGQMTQRQESHGVLEGSWGRDRAGCEGPHSHLPRRGPESPRSSAGRPAWDAVSPHMQSGNRLPAPRVAVTVHPEAKLSMRIEPTGQRLQFLQIGKCPCLTE